MARDSLKWAIGRANLTGAQKTQYNNKRQAERFVDVLRECGLGVQKWSNLNNKHVATVVEKWKDRGLSTATIKTYLGSVREVAKAYGNDKIAEKNQVFGLGRREYITNEDKSLKSEDYERAVATLRASDDPYAERTAMHLELQRALGLRKEESWKLDLRKDFDPEKRTMLVQYGTKGGRPRLLEDLSDTQDAALEKAKAFISESTRTAGRFNLLPADLTERQYENAYYRLLRGAGISRRKSGASSHGNRHARAQELYRDIAGFEPPARFGKDSEAFRQNAAKRLGIEKIPGKARDAEIDGRHEKALAAVNVALGHGSGRRVSGVYVGKK